MAGVDGSSAERMVEEGKNMKRIAMSLSVIVVALGTVTFADESTKVKSNAEARKQLVSVIEKQPLFQLEKSKVEQLRDLIREFPGTEEALESRLRLAVTLSGRKKTKKESDKLLEEVIAGGGNSWHVLMAKCVKVSNLAKTGDLEDALKLGKALEERLSAVDGSKDVNCKQFREEYTGKRGSVESALHLGLGSICTDLKQFDAAESHYRLTPSFTAPTQEGKSLSVFAVLKGGDRHKLGEN